MKKSNVVTEKLTELCQGCNCRCHKNHGGGDSPLYGIGLIGAGLYFIPGSSTLSEWVWHIFQTITWPGFVVYHLLQFIGIGK